VLFAAHMRSIVTDRAAWSVGLSVCHTSEPCKTAAPIEMPSGLKTQMGTRNHVLDGGPDPPRDMAILRGKGASHCKVQGHYAVPC